MQDTKVFSTVRQVSITIKLNHFDEDFLNKDHLYKEKYMSLMLTNIIENINKRKRWVVKILGKNYFNLKKQNLY